MPTQYRYRDIFAGLNKGSFAFWLLLILGILFLLFVADERVYMHFFASQHTPLAQYHSYLYHHGMVFVGLTLPILLMQRFKITAEKFPLLQLGDWRWGLKATIFFALIFILPTWMTSFDAQFLQEYPLAPSAFDNIGSLALFMLVYFLYYIGWESFFRGFMTYGMIGIGARPLTALLMQVVVSTIVHIGKPDMEVLGAVAGGFIFGIVTMRSGSVIWAILLHAFLGFINTFFCHYHQGI